MKRNKQVTKLSKITVKSSLILSLILLGVSPDKAEQNLAKADTSLSVLDGQNGCPVDTDDSGDSKDDDSSSKDDKKKDDSGSDSTKFNSKNIKAIYDKLHGDYGFSGQFIAGILANWHVESNIDPLATEGDTGSFSKSKAKSATDTASTGIGWGQWTNVRHTQLVKYAKKKDKDWFDPDLQLDFMVTQDSSKETLKKLAKNAGKDPKDETVNFHDDWEVSASSRSTVLAERGDVADDIWKYMKKEGMDGGKDEKKIDKINGSSGESAPKGESSATNKGTPTTEDPCDSQKDDNSNEGSQGTGAIGESTKKNGKKGKTIGSNYTYSDLPSKYKKYVKIPKFDKSYLDKTPNPYLGENLGQCTELTYFYMWQMWGKKQAHGDKSPTEDGNGGVLWKSYKNHGAKITDKPTVGYGFSSKPPYVNAPSAQPGHTGVVAGVMPDGKFIVAQFNVNPHPAKSQVVLYSVIDGTDGGDGLKFFSGIEGSKDPSKKGKDKK